MNERELLNHVDDLRELFQGGPGYTEVVQAAEEAGYTMSDLDHFLDCLEKAAYKINTIDPD